MITHTLQFFKEKSFGWDDGAETALESMNGLSIYIMAPLTEEEVTEDVDYANYVTNACSTTSRDIQNLYKRKASVPSSFANMLVIVKTFENLLNTLFGLRCHSSFIFTSMS